MPWTNKRVGDAIYHTTRWRKLRQVYYEHQHGICEHCQQPGDLVDHIEEITTDNVDDPFITYNWDNLQLLCIPCHNIKTFRKHHSTREGFSFDDEGNLIKTK